jgi:hypothetical protein
MSLLREAPLPAAVVAVNRVLRDQRQHDVIDRRLDQLERERDAILRAAAPCRQAAGHLPDGEGRERLLRRTAALGCELDPFADLRALHQDAA